MTSESGDDTLLLLNRHHQGDATALEELLERNLPWLHQHAHNRLGPNQRGALDTVDLVQAAAARFLQAGPRVRVANRSKLRALLGRIVLNLLRTNAKSRSVVLRARPAGTANPRAVDRLTSRSERSTADESIA